MSRLFAPVLLAASFIAAPAFAHETTSLLNIGATVLAPHVLANVAASVASTPAHSAPVSSSLVDVKASVPGVAKANVDVAGHGQLLGVSLDLGGNTQGGVGHSGDHW